MWNHEERHQFAGLVHSLCNANALAIGILASPP